MGQLDDFFPDLHGQLASGHQDQCLRAAFLVRPQPLDDRNRERCRFAGSRAGLAKRRSRPRRAGNQPGLNRGGLDISGMLQSRHHRLGQQQVLESRGGLHRRVGQDYFL